MQHRDPKIEAEEYRASRETARRQLVIVCLLGTVVTCWGWLRSIEQHEQDNRARFHFESERAIATLEESLDDITLVVHSSAGLVAASQAVEAHEWATFASDVFGYIIASGATRLEYVAEGPDGLEVLYTYPSYPNQSSGVACADERHALATAVHQTLITREPTSATLMDPDLGREVEVIVMASGGRTAAQPQGMATCIAVWLDPERLISSIAAGLDPGLNLCVHREARFTTCSQAYEADPLSETSEVVDMRRVAQIAFGDGFWTFEVTASPGFLRADLTSAFILATGLLLTVLLGSVVGSLHLMKGRAIRLAESMTSELRASQERLRHDSLHDALTGLPNRMLFRRRLLDRLQRASVEGDHNFAVLFLDLDRFKVINDSLGHAAGDELLIAVSRRLERGLRCCNRPIGDTKGDTIARMGGDEFTVLLDQLEQVDDAFTVAERLQRELNAPYRLSDHEVFTSASVGIRLGDPECLEPEDVLRDADTAMYQAKAGGKARHATFDGQMRQDAGRRLTLENDLRRAVDHGEIRVQFQPVVTLGTLRLVGFEALARWRHPDGWEVSPAEFIPLAEDLGLIGLIGDIVLNESCRTLQTWRRQLGRTDLVMSVNVSRRQIADPGLAERVTSALRATDVPADRLILEITESVVMDDPATAGLMIQKLRDVGVQFWMDDFGTGYSSLSCLHRLPLDGLKIDRSFIANLESGRHDASVVSAIVSLAHNLGIAVTAEGVESSLQVAQLQSMQCDRGQGYFFARPLDVAAATEFIRSAGSTAKTA